MAPSFSTIVDILAPGSIFIKIPTQVAKLLPSSPPSGTHPHEPRNTQQSLPGFPAWGMAK